MPEVQTQRQDVVSEAAALVAAFEGTLGGVEWMPGDDKCDCTFQRIGWWTNPYIARTLLVRVCCIWAELYKQFPQFVQEIPAYNDPNTDALVSEPMEWNGEHEMPRHLFHRQIASRLGMPLAAVRAQYGDVQPPAGVPKHDWSGG